MADLPNANVSVDDQAGAFGGGTGFPVVMSCCEKNADAKPRIFSSTKALLAQHGYSPGADLSSLYFDEANQPVVFIGLPTAVAGAIGRQNSTGVTGSSAVSAAAGLAGVLEEVDAIVTVSKGGTVGTDKIVLSLSLDGGRTEKAVRLGTASSYTIPYVGIVLNFGAGTLNDEDVYTFTSTAPMWDAAGLTSARTNLAAQKKLSRTWNVIGDLPDDTHASYVTTEANAYETANKRFTVARVQVRDRLPVAEAAKVQVRMTGNPSITFAEVGGTGDTITRSAGSFVSDGFLPNMAIDVALSVSNNFTKAKITAVSATVLTLDTQDLVAEGPVAGVSIVGSPGLTFAEVGVSGDTILRSSGSWLDDGFRVGDTFSITGSVSNNIVAAPIAALTATLLTLGSVDLTPEFIGMKDVTITKGETMAAWVAAMDAEFDSVDDEKRIDIGLGRGRKLSPITKWEFRRPVQWAAAIREYQHDLQIPTWRKADGPCKGWDLEDDDENTVEFDERSDGGALAARFTCFRTWPTGPSGAFIALSLTRAPEGSLLSRTHNAQVTNLACTVTQAETENAIGQVLVLDPATGKGTDAALQKIETRVNKALETNLLESKKEGPRASMATWSASRDDVLNVPGAKLHGTLRLELNGTIEEIDTVVEVLTAGG